MILREIIDIVAGYSKFADTLHETLPQNISSIFAMPGKIMDLRTRQLFWNLIPLHIMLISLEMGSPILIINQSSIPENGKFVYLTIPELHQH